MDEQRGFRGNRGRSGFRPGMKRRREQEEPAPDPYRSLLSDLLYFGDDYMPDLSIPEDAVYDICRELRTFIKDDVSSAQTMILDVAMEIPAKASVYALLVGLMNVDDGVGMEFAEGLVEKLSQEIESALPEDCWRARTLLRFAAQLVVCGVVEPDSLFKILFELTEVVVNFQEKSLAQPYLDHLVHIVLMTLPFGGSELLESNSKALDKILDDIENYLQNRDRAFKNLRPFAANISSADHVSSSDYGSGAHLRDMVASIRTMVDSASFAPASIPRVHLNYEARLALNASRLSLRSISNDRMNPLKSDLSAPNKAAIFLTNHPSREIVRLLDEKHTKGDRPLIDRVVTEDYIIDIVHFFEGNRVECAKRLARCIPAQFPYEPLLCEVLFNQMLRLPSSEFKSIMYGALMVDLCKVLDTFPRAMSACVRECFSRINVMDPCLRQRLAEWLAYHVSNYEYVWPWQKWVHVLEAPLYDGQRRFCMEVIERMIRLSYWERIHDVLPSEFRVLLPPKPEVETLPDDALETNIDDLEGVWAARALAMVRQKVTAEELDSWMKSNALEAVLQGKVNLVKMLVRCLLVAGQKSYSHMIIALERYYGPLALMISEAGKDAQLAALDMVARVWSRNAQRAVMAIDRLMTLRLVSADCTIEWAFGYGIDSIDNHFKFSLSWETLHRAMDKIVARVDDAKDELRKAKQDHVDGTALPDIQAKQEVLQDYEAQRKEAVTKVVQQYLMLAESCFSKSTKYTDLASMEEIVSLDETSSEQDVGALHILLCLQSFLRRYYLEVAECFDELRPLFSGQKAAVSVINSFLNV